MEPNKGKMPAIQKQKKREVEMFELCVFASGVVRPPGFEPGSSAWEADVLARLDYGRTIMLS